MLYEAEIRAAAAAHGLDPRVVAAVVAQESAFRTDAFRYEPAFWLRYMAGRPEYHAANPRRVSSSYGLMQLMYEVAKELGFTGPPELLFVPETGLDYGCRQLRALTDWADKGWPTLAADARLRAVLAAYNGGKGGNAPDAPLRNEPYAAQVLAHYGQLGTAFVASTS